MNSNAVGWREENQSAGGMVVFGAWRKSQDCIRKRSVVVATNSPMDWLIALSIESDCLGAAVRASKKRSRIAW